MKKLQNRKGENHPIIIGTRFANDLWEVVTIQAN